MPSQLQRRIAATVAEADRLSAAFARQLARILRDLEGEIRRLVREAHSASATVRTARAMQARQVIREALERAGYAELAREATSASLDRMAARVLRTRAAAGVSSLHPDTSQILGALKSLHLADLLEEGDAVVNQVTRAVTRGLLGAANPVDLIEEVAKVLDTSSTRVAALYDTAVSIYGRQVEATQAGDDPDTPFLYSGPVDSKTRPWCLARVGKVFRRADIDDMDNGQIANPFLSGGGYNCRHAWVQISEFSELYPLRKTGERAPEYEAAMQRVKDAKE